jgi:hypothetical protein
MEAKTPELFEFVFLGIKERLKEAPYYALEKLLE